MFVRNKGYNTANYYKIEVNKTSSGTTVSIYELSSDGDLTLKKTSDILKSEEDDFVESLRQMLADLFICVEDRNSKKITWINKSLVKSIDVEPKNNHVSMTVEALNGYTETFDVAESYPEFNLFWFKNWKSNVPNDTVLFVPSKDSVKRGKRSKVESVVNMF